MRIAFCYPPFSKKGRFANLPQNRQFIYTASPEVRIFPVVMATAATWLKNLGHEVLWLDGITKRLSLSSFQQELFSFKPEILILEAKTPVMNQIWKCINNMKNESAGQRIKLKIVLVGDHVSYFPEESFKNSKVDFVLTGGDWDFLLKNLIQHLENKEKLEQGVWYREKSKIIDTGKFRLNHNLDETPLIDRKLTCWRDYGEAYLFRPCAYVMFGRGCGIDNQRTGACTFCIWQQGLWNYSSRMMSPQRAIAEVKNLVKLGVKEIFDDTESGVLKDYKWLLEFYRLLKKENLLAKVIFSSNARGDQLDVATCRLLKKIGYRLLKVGLESGSDKILKNILKKETVKQIIQGVKNAKDAGLRVMLTVMVGYPWENQEDVKKTFNITKSLMMYKTRAGDCLQASVVTPYPGTVLWQMSKRNDWLTINSLDLEKYDMSRPILKSGIDAKYWCSRIWSIQKDYQFIFKSGITVRNFDELFLLLRGAKSLLGHIRDYAKT